MITTHNLKARGECRRKKRAEWREHNTLKKLKRNLKWHKIAL